MLKMFRVLGRVCVLVAMPLLPAVNSSAGSVLYQFEPISTGPFPGGQTPQVTAAFQDISPGKVLLTISTANLINGEFLSDLYFNFDPADNVNQLHFTRCYGPAAPVLAKVSIGENSFKVGGYGNYDIHLAFSKASVGKFSGGDIVTYQITEPRLDALDFAFMASVGCGPGPYYALACVQQLCGNTQWLGSSTVQPQPVPEPASTSFLALAAGAGCVCLRRRRTNRTHSVR